MKTIIKTSDLDLQSKCIKIKRVTKVTRGGRKMQFTGLVVTGDTKNVVGFGLGRSKEIPLAIEKGTNKSKKNLIRVPIICGTIPHSIRYKYKGSKVFLAPAAEGTGIIAGGAMRAVLESAGVTNVLAKVRGSNNPHNIVIATIKALESLRDAYEIARLRGIPLQKVFNG